RTGNCRSASRLARIEARVTPFLRSPFVRQPYTAKTTMSRWHIFVVTNRLIICANHAIRAAVAAMRAAFARILDQGGIAGVESTIAAVAEIFALQGDDRMRELEMRFLR